jgi:hypothetical protein
LRTLDCVTARFAVDTSDRRQSDVICGIAYLPVALRVAPMMITDATTGLGRATVGTDLRRNRARPAVLCAQLAIVAVVCGLLAAFRLRNHNLRVEPFFDEMWRIDAIRSTPTRLLPTANASPAPIGWMYLFKTVYPLFGPSPAWYRIGNIVLYALGVAPLVLLLRRLSAAPGATRLERRLIAGAVVVTPVVLTLLDAIQPLENYFNNYLFEAAYTTLLVWLCVELHYTRRALVPFVVAAALAPLFVISGLALLPALYASALWWAYHNEQRRRLVRMVTASAAAAGVVGIVVLQTVYRPLFTGAQPLRHAWLHELVSTSGSDFLRLGRTGWLLEKGVFEQAIARPSTWQHVVLGVVLAGCFAVGAVTFSRRWPWFGVLIASGWVITLILGIVLDGPVTPTRVTLAYWFIVDTTIVYGFFRACAYVVSRVPVRSSWRELGFGAIVLAVVVFLWPAPPYEAGGYFVQGLQRDLAVVANSPTRENLVLSYHFMTYVYTHDRLVNQSPPGHTFTVLADQRGDPTLYSDVDRLVLRHLPRGGMLWCIEVYELGPERASKACHVHVPAQLVVSEHRARALILGYRINAP